MISFTRLLEQRVRFADSGDAEGSGTVGDARRIWSERRTLVVVVEDGEGNVGLGEAAPLPEYSPDSLDDAFRELAPLVGARLSAARAPESLDDLRDATASLASPSARFALESALLELAAKRRLEPAWAPLVRFRVELEQGYAPDEASVPRSCPVAALLPTDQNRVFDHAERAFARGIRCFKAKVGARDAWTDELELLREIRSRFPDVRLRVDANQGFSGRELWQRLPALRELDLEWLEEPVRHFPRDLETPVDIPLALDESLQSDPPSAAVARGHGVRAFVLKPTTVGGLIRSLELARDARDAGLAVVVSHTYEGPVGFSAVTALALALGSGRPADGLDRHAAIASASDLPALSDAILPALSASYVPAPDMQGFVWAWNESGFGVELATLLERNDVMREVRA